jgi:hypothetical protein
MDTRSGQIRSKRHHRTNQLPDSTSYFREVDVLTLNIEYRETENFLPTSPSQAPKEIYISHKHADSFRNCLYDETIIFDLSRKERTLAKLISYVMANEIATIGTEESRTDSFVDRILRTLEFDEDPLMLQLKPTYKFSVYDKSITSKYDFGVTRNGRILLVDEDKHIANTGPSTSWGEYQIAGEMLCGAANNYRVTSSTDWIYAVRVIGTKFTFYKSSATQDYLNEISSGFPEENYMIIFRYPPLAKEKKFPHFDFANPDERKQIVQTLLNLREELQR